MEFLKQALIFIGLKIIEIIVFGIILFVIVGGGYLLSKILPDPNLGMVIFFSIVGIVWIIVNIYVTRDIYEKRWGDPIGYKENQLLQIEEYIKGNQEDKLKLMQEIAELKSK